MYTVSFDKPISIYFIGIGGISMSGLAHILHDRDFTISGSDANPSDTTFNLESLGIQINYSHEYSNITSDIDLVVFSAAIKPTNSEYMAAIDLNIPIISRAELLGQIMNNYSYSFAVSGTHGKTTTTSMLSEILLKANLDPTITVGGILDAIDGNIHIGATDYFITEACEYCDSFLSFFPKYAIVLNIEEDHLDYFKDINHIRNSFKKFIANIPSNGALIINSDIDSYSFFTNDLQCSYITFGTNRELSDVCADNIVFNSDCTSSYDLYIKGRYIDKLQLSSVGMHNVYNSLAAIAAAMEINVPIEIIKLAFCNFKNAHRRFEFKGYLNNTVRIIDDYAHHPSEITATLKTAKVSHSGELWCIFQPHTYSRTKAFLSDFASALSLADHIILADIYAAREKPVDGITSEVLMHELKKLNPNVKYFNNFADIEKYVISSIPENAMLITMGAGNVYTIGDDLLKK